MKILLVPSCPGPAPRVALLAFLLPVLVASCDDSGNSGRRRRLASLQDMALYFDVDRDGTVNAGDEVILRFNRAVDPASASTTGIVLEAAGDDFGAGATLVDGPALEEVTVVLGTNPILTLRGNAGSLRLDPAVGAPVVTTGNGREAKGSAPLSPGFVQPAAAASFGFPAREVAGGDLDQDGDVDLVLGLDNSTPNQVWMNDGSGNFTDSGQALGNGRTQTVVIGDLDGDGDLDFIEGNQQFDPNQSWLNDGTGTFTTLQSFGQGRAEDLALGDLDGDGDLDLVEGTGDGRPDLVWTNDGTGMLIDTGQQLGNETTHTVALGDLDWDGDLDIVEGNTDKNKTWVNDGTGIFTSGNDVGSGDSLALADYDCDGDLDLLSAGRDPARLWFNDGTGDFTMSDSLGNAATDTAVVADLDRDGLPDFVGANLDGEPNEVWFLDENGELIDSGARLGTEVSADGFAGDLDGDGDLDLVFANVDVPSTVWFNSIGAGDATWQSPLAGFGDGDTQALVTADFNRDGAPDLFEGDGALGAGSVLWFGDQLGGFTASANTFAGGETTAVALDLEGDGDLDLITGGNGEPVRFYRNDGDGDQVVDALTLTAGPTVMLLAGDLDGDGDKDLVRVEGTGTASTVLFNDGSGIFTDSGQALAGADTRLGALGDLDLDGDLDLVLGQGAAADILLTNDGTGTFTAAGTAGSALDLQALVLADFDGDGDLDMARGAAAAAIEILRNDGALVFTDTAQALGSGANALVAVDADEDGDLDLVEGIFGAADRLWLNDGTGTFVDSGQSLFAGSTSALAVADLDCDGDVDLIAGDGAVGSNEVFLNR